MATIYVQNASKLVSDADLAKMTASCGYQVRRYAAPWWNLVAPAVVVLPAGAPRPSAGVLIGVFDEPDMPNALGWHTEDPGDVVYGRVFAHPVLANGGQVLSGEISVSATLSHEVCEALVDPHVSSWEQAGDGMLYATEVCDPVESTSYTDSVGVSLSDFVTPHWFDPNAAATERFSALGTVRGPFQLAAGGYVVKMAGGVAQPVFSDEYPRWRKATKASPLSRTSRRVTRS